MTLKIYFNEEKTSSQIIHMTDRARYNSRNGKESLKSPQEIADMCRSIAHDVSRNNYTSVDIVN